MLIELDAVRSLYDSLEATHAAMRAKLSRPLTLAEKVLFSHMDDPTAADYRRGTTDLLLRPDRVAMQDATAQMAILQFMTAGLPTTAVPATVHCDHLIQAHHGASKDMTLALDTNREVYDFLYSAAMKYGMGFWKAGAGIINQVVLENYAVPGMMMVGTDSHTPNAGGLGMIAIGVGGADAVDVMTGQGFGTRAPKLVGIKLTGKLAGWTAPKDVILKVAQLLTVKGGTGKIVEYFGAGAETISCTGKGTISNMGAEIGATCSIFNYDDAMGRYLRATDRGAVAELADAHRAALRADPECHAHPEKVYDEVYEIDLSTLEPQIVGPHTPDLGRPVSQWGADTEKNGWPTAISAALIGSCTNSSYEDLTRAVSIARQAAAHGLKAKADFFVSPGSDRIHETIDRDGILADFEKVGGVVLANACGPCIGQWKRDNSGGVNTIITSFNRNFKKRADGNPDTQAFIGSPEIVVAAAIAGTTKFNPATDELTGADGKRFKLQPPVGIELPAAGFATKEGGYVAPTNRGTVTVNPQSARIALLEPFGPRDPKKDFENLPILVKALGKCTTDHVSPAGPWLKFRGHLDAISNNMYIGAVNAFTEEAGKGTNVLTGETHLDFNQVARSYKAKGLGWVVVADENYGEGSSREHAAMEPRHLGGRAIIARSFARIAEANLKKQGILPLWFKDKADYDLFQETDRVTIEGVAGLAPGQEVTLTVRHENNTTAKVACTHTLNQTEIAWFHAGSALNYLKQQQEKARV